MDITAKGFRRTLRFVKPGVTEYEVEAEWAREFIRRRGKFAYTRRSSPPEKTTACCTIFKTIKFVKKASCC